MKKILIISILMLFCTTLIGCGGNELEKVNTVAVDKIKTNDCETEARQKVVWGEKEFEIPGTWSYEMVGDEEAVYIYPNQETALAFTFMTIDNDEIYDFSDETIIEPAARGIVKAFSEVVGDCNFVSCNVPKEYFELASGTVVDLTVDYTLEIACDGVIDEKPYSGFIRTFYKEDILYALVLFEYVDSKYTFYNDFVTISKTIKNADTENALEYSENETYSEENDEEELDDLGYIEGCNSYTIMENMKSKYEIPKPDPIESSGVSGGYIFSALDGTYQYEIYTTNNLSDVYMADFSIHRGNMDTTTFMNTGIEFLKYVATIPYETSDSEKVLTWIDNTVSELEMGRSHEFVCGDAKFTLYGDWNQDVIYLDVSLEPFPY